MKHQLCEKCYSQIATELHHKFSQTKRNKKVYPEFIHHKDNIMFLCYNCHHNKALEKWTEKEFCKNFNINIRGKNEVARNKYSS